MKEYFEKLLNVENRRDKIQEVEKVEILVNIIQRWEVGKDIRNTKRGKAAGSSNSGTSTRGWRS